MVDVVDLEDVLKQSTAELRARFATVKNRLGSAVVGLL